MKYIALLLLLMLWFAIALPASASFCRNIDERLICIVSINRSAKNHWEYRVAISVDGVKSPIELYDCRDRVKVQKDRTLVPFEPNSVGELICSLVNR